MRRVTIPGSVLLISVLLFTFTGSAMARKGCPGPCYGKGMPGNPPARVGPTGMLFDLGLSDQQIEGIIDIHNALLKDEISSKRKMKDVSIQLRQLKQEDKPDTEKLRNLIEEKGTIQAEMAVNKATARSKALEILTPEQREKLGDNPLPFFHSKCRKQCCMGMNRSPRFDCPRRGMNAPPVPVGEEE